ncbi:MAG TPA: sigma-E factor regulatory protein RseB domain-containing protein [Mycobacteriales bacterium]|nr:sigma-E factor regulatory protein RseB domain-containing protein [Mycobacteriales bacterium]
MAVTGAALVPGPSPAGDPHRARAPRPAGATPLVSPALRDADAGAAPGALLERAAAAADAVAYSGVRLVRGPTRAAIVDLVHVPGHATLLRVRPAAPPAHAVGAAPFQRYPDREATGKPHAAVAPLGRAYDVSLAGTGTILGREADLVELRGHGRHDRQGRLAARLWLDRRTGLTLRRDVFDATGAVVRSSAFVALAVADAVPRGPAADRQLARGPERPPSLLALPARPLPLPTARRPQARHPPRGGPRRSTAGRSCGCGRPAGRCRRRCPPDSCWPPFAVASARTRPSCTCATPTGWLPCPCSPLAAGSARACPGRGGCTT